MKNLFGSKGNDQPFGSYEEYMEYLFACVNEGLNRYLVNLKRVYATGEGGYKNVLYPDLEIAHDICVEKIEHFLDGQNEEGDFWGNGNVSGFGDDEAEGKSGEDEDGFLDLDALFSDFAMETSRAAADGQEFGGQELSVEEMVDYINVRAERSLDEGISLPYYELCKKLDYGNFTVFCLACGILSSTQTDYAGVFQVINENGGFPAPTIESAAKLYFGNHFSITGAYGHMSVCLEQLLPILDLHVQGNMPFSTAVSPDKRMIDYLFGKNPMKLDENYIRFFQMLTTDEELDPILANQGVLEAMEISYGEGGRIFAYFGDEGSGRKFFVKHFCKTHGMRAVSLLLTYEDKILCFAAATDSGKHLAEHLCRGHEDKIRIETMKTTVWKGKDEAWIEYDLFGEINLIPRLNSLSAVLGDMGVVHSMRYPKTNTYPGILADIEGKTIRFSYILAAPIEKERFVLNLLYAAPKGEKEFFDLALACQIINLSSPFLWAVLDQNAGRCFYSVKRRSLGES